MAQGGQLQMSGKGLFENSFGQALLLGAKPTLHAMLSLRNKVPAYAILVTMVSIQTQCLLRKETIKPNFIFITYITLDGLKTDLQTNI